MLLHAYTVYDNKSLTYSPPFFAVQDGVATRMFQDLVNDTNTSVGQHPADYTLYCVGTFNDATAQLEPTAPKRHLTDALPLVRQQPQLFAEHANGGLRPIGRAPDTLSAAVTEKE